VRAAALLAAAAVVGAALLVPGAAEAQCAMCRTALGSPEGKRLIAAFQSGIVLLLAVPMAILAGGAWYVVRGQRRLREIEQDETVAGD